MRDSPKRLIHGKILGSIMFCLLFLNCSWAPAQSISSFSQSSSMMHSDDHSSYVLPVAGMSHGGSSPPHSLLGDNYLIGPGDVLEVKIFDSEDLDRQVRVGGDGYISLPLIGSIVANGLSVPDLEFNTAFEYSRKYLQNPQVSIYILEFHSKTVAVIGKVRNPQVLELPKNKIRLIELLGLCGGLEEGAGDTIYIIRPTEQYNGRNSSDIQYAEVVNGSSQKTDNDYRAEDNWTEENYLKITDAVTTVKISELVKFHNPISNMDILPGDTISIPPASYYFVFGEVDKPGAFMVGPGMTALQAITRAGKFARDAKTKIKLIREDAENGEKIITTVNIKNIAKGKEEDIKIQAGDVLLVGKSTAKMIGYQILDFSREAVSVAQGAMVFKAIDGD